jgi:uncharacterized membrane protein
MPLEAATPVATARERVQSIDVLRGAVIVLMILDHARTFLHESEYAYNPLDPAHTTWLIYVTRWITHLCAPTFVFLAGVSIWIRKARGANRSALSGFLVKRGAWLVFLELTVISFGLSFQIPYTLDLQVIWAIGISMIVLAALSGLPRWAVLTLGVAIVAGHNTLDAFRPDMGHWPGDLWGLVYEPGALTYEGDVWGVKLYPVLPWVGVMALGYGLGPLLLDSSVEGDRRLLALGSAMVLTFLLLRATGLYGDPHPWSSQPEIAPSVMTFFNVTKYPPSLLYVCATLGPVLMLMPVIRRCRCLPMSSTYT